MQLGPGDIDDCLIWMIAWSALPIVVPI